MLACYRSFALVVGVAAMAFGCELMVQLDRSTADAGADAGCNICTDVAAFGDAGTDVVAADAEASDAPPSHSIDSGPADDARSDGPVSDAGGG